MIFGSDAPRQLLSLSSSCVLAKEFMRRFSPATKVRSRIPSFLRLSDNSAHRSKDVLDTVVEFGI
jgi:hypothetical protein